MRCGERGDPRQSKFRAGEGRAVEIEEPFQGTFQARSRTMRWAKRTSRGGFLSSRRGKN